ncbi:MAG: N-acylglucosamine 2-epimerase [Ruminococcaceae bacterium]|nr:N-acylglucosamine 2-epimerase [Oscillospiraceae bacterium]
MNYRSDLVNNILPFWLKDAIDYENGGIYTCLSKEGNIYGTDKSVWFQGRALWVFSKAYNCIEKNEEYLKAAKNIYKFFPKCTDTDGRMFFTVTNDGRELQKRRYYFSETFAAIGCAELYKATGDKEVLESAEKYFTVAYECFKGIRKNPPKINPENQQTKALSPVMIMLATAQVMRSIDGLYDKYNAIAKECLDEILHGGYLTERALLESVSVDGKFIDSPNGRIVNPGHSLEAAWFILAEGLVTNNDEAIAAAKRIIDITLPLGIDKKHGGIIAFTDLDGKPPVQLEWDMKLWWPQCETMIALRLAYTVFKDEKYLKLYEEFKEYCEKYFVDNEHGEWYGYLHYDNTVSTTLKGNIFKGPFHIPRLYIIMAMMDEFGGILEYMN